jgi:enterochelin esterase-like enzyme
MPRLRLLLTLLALTACGLTASPGCTPGSEPPTSEPGADAGPAADAGAADAGTDAGVREVDLFLEMVDEAQANPLAKRQALVDEFLAQHGSALPFVTSARASFVYVDGNATSVKVAGDHTCWDSAPEALTRLEGTTLWYRTDVLPVDARLDYKFIVDGTWVLDPRNPRQVPSGFGPNSELAMPGWPYPWEIDFDAAIPHGTVVKHAQLYSAALDNRRDVQVYLPPGYPANGPYASFYVHDGHEYLSLASMTNVLDKLLALGRIEPLVVVFVPPVQRSAEYVGAKVPQFIQFVAEELVPFIDGQYATAQDPLRRGVMGTSNGGYISLKLGLAAPELFRRIGSQSGAVRADGAALTHGWATTAPAGHRIFLSTGTFCDFKSANDTLRNRLELQGFEHVYPVFNEGHSWGLWRGHLDELLTFLWPKP